MLQLRKQVDVHTHERQDLTAATPKTCPRCRKKNDYETRICTCGHWFADRALAQHHDALYEHKKHKSEIKRSKILILLSFVLSVFVAAGIYGGFIDLNSLFKNTQNASSSSPKESISEPSVNNRQAAKNTLTGKVISIDKTGTITIQTESGQNNRIKLSGIELPNNNENFVQQYYDQLSTMLADKNVLVIQQKIDGDGTILGKVNLDGRNINLELINSGFAAFDKNSENYQSDEDNRLFTEAETSAKNARLGIWSASIYAQSARNSKFIKSERPVTSTANESAETSAVENSDRSGQNDASLTSAPAAQANNAVLSEPSPSIQNLPPPVPVPKSDSQPAEIPTKPAKSVEPEYFLGPRGGCYRISASGSKRYVDKSMCKPSR